MLSGPVSRALAASAPRVVVVGGGLAGLTAAYRLKQAGINAQLFEASDRLGGRCWTRRGDFAEGQIAEHGGELIDQGHTEIRQLAQELGLNLDNLVAAEVNGTDPFHYFDGQPYSYEEATTSRKSGSRSTRTSPPPAIRRSTTATPSAAANSMRCRSPTGSGPTCREG
jgi:monoamine oxidase